MSCFVKSCKNYRQKCISEGQAIQFHRFPADEERRQQWINVCNQESGKWKSRHTICSAHFDVEDYLDLECGILLSNAIPKKNLQRANVVMERKIRQLQEEVSKWKSMFCKLKQDSKEKKMHLNSKIYKLTLIGRRWKCAKEEGKNKWKTKYLQAKKQVKELRQAIYTAKLAKASSKKERIEAQLVSLKPIFTDSQIEMVLTNKTKTWWNEENVSKAMCLRAKSPSAYDFVRKQWKIPLPSLSTLGRWVKNIKITPGLILPVLNLLKFEFQDKDELERQCCLSFDEMSLDGSVCYDPAEDKVVGPHSSLMVVFVRGLFSKWKQPVYFGYDDKLDNNVLIKIIQEVQKCNITFRSSTNDNATTNTGKWKKLGVNHENTSFAIPDYGNRVYCFSDAPHLIKLLRNNLLDHGFTLKDGTTIGKEDFEKIIKADVSEFKICPHLTKQHLEVEGSERQNVRMACETVSHRTATALKYLYPDCVRKSEFIQLANDFFDVMNSRNNNDSNPLKCGFGNHFELQAQILDKFADEIAHMKVGSSKALYPFQKGILMSIKSLKSMYEDLKSSLKIKYIFTARLNQDLAENAFCIIRSFGGSKPNPSPVDAKYRLRMLLISWHLLIARRTSPVLQDEDYIDNISISAKVLFPLLQEQADAFHQPIADDIEESLADLPGELVEEITVENWLEYNEDFSLDEKCEFGGQEYVCGFLCKKLSKKYSNMLLSKDEERRDSQSWSQTLSQGHLAIPSYDWLNLFRQMNQYFVIFHCYRNGNKWPLNDCNGVVEVLSRRIHEDYRDVDFQLIKHFVRLRTFIRIKHINNKISNSKLMLKKWRKKQKFVKSFVPDPTKQVS